MIRNLTEGKNCNYKWIDVCAPQPEEMAVLAQDYNLHEASVNDCLQPGHLPKYEQLKQYTFIIVRVYFESSLEADTVQEITNKISIFINTHYIITIHRQPIALIDTIADEILNENTCKIPQHVLTEIVKAALHSYDEPGNSLTQSIEYYETKVFLTQRKTSMLKGLYFVKRKLDVIRRLLLLTYDIVDKIDPAGESNAYTRDVRDLYIKQKSLYDSLSENTNHILSIYFNISAQRTNEIVKVLTVFSVFFMPLTFIVGVYGMNFRHMPELEWRYGYPLSLASMAVVVIVIYIWFRRRKWL